MKQAPWLVVLGILLAAIPSPATAGTQLDPEIKDPAGDGGTNGKDIVAVWLGVSEDEKGLLVNIEAGANPTPEYPSFHAIQVRFTLWFKPTAGLPTADKKAAYVSVRIANGQTSPTTVSNSAYFGTTTAAGTFDNLNNEVGLAAPTVTGKVIAVVLPLTNLKGFKVGTDSLTDVWANVVLANKGPAAVAGGPDANNIQSTYDRAPNTGFGRAFSTAPQAPALSVTLSADKDETTVAPGAPATFALTLGLVGEGAANFTFNATDVPDGWHAMFEPESVGLDAATNSTTLNLTVHAPADAENGSVAIQVQAVGPDNLNASLNLTITIDASLAAPPASGAPGANATEAAANETAGAKEGEGGGIPGPGVGLAAGSAFAAAVAIRRRRSA